MRRLASLLVLVLTPVVLAGCVSAALRPEGEGLSWVYGHFCGKGYPDLGTGSTQEQLARLDAIAPADSIDAACKAHDRCYLQQGMHQLRCDDALTRTAYKMRFDGPDRRACARLADQIGRFFACAMPSTGDGMDAVVGALKPLTGMHPLCPGFTHADLIGALQDAPQPGTCIARDSE